MTGISTETTAREAERLHSIIVPLMEAAGLDASFIVESATLALFDHRVYELMALWVREEVHRGAIVQDLEQWLDEHRRWQPLSVRNRLR